MKTPENRKKCCEKMLSRRQQYGACHVLDSGLLEKMKPYTASKACAQP
jgi:hypothetical protein